MAAPSAPTPTQRGGDLPAWDAEAADAKLRQTLAVLDSALSTTWLSPSQRRVLAVFRQQVGDYHARHDPQLFGFPGWVRGYLERWRAELAQRQGLTPRCHRAADG
jgi:hypothetical protein